VSLGDFVNNTFRAAPPASAQFFQNVNPTLAMEWTMRAGLYQTCWDWYDGTKLKELTDNGTLKYPLRINPIRWICKKHARTLYGETPDDAPSLVQFSFKNDEGKVDETCKAAARIVGRVWSESHGAEIQFGNGLINQVCGNSVTKLLWRPGPGLTYGVRLMRIIPDYFMPIWDSEDPWDLAEGYLSYCITPEEARSKYGVNVRQNQYPIYMEHWTRDSFDISVEGKTPTTRLQAWEGPNDWGFVPFVVTPHEDRTDGFYGSGHIFGIDGLVEELNWRMADRGDGVKAANQDQTVMKNSSTGIKVRTAGAKSVLDIGTSPPGSTKDPDMWNLEPGAVKSAALNKQFTEDLWNYICNASDTPAVVWGESEVSSQRSGMSLEMLYLALLGHIRAERIMMGIGFGVTNSRILRMINSKMPGKVSYAMLQLEPRTRWSKILPRERMDVVNEMNLRTAGGFGSTSQPPRRCSSSY